MLDCWAFLTQRLKALLPPAKRCISRRFFASLRVLGNLLPNAAPTGMCATLCGNRPVGEREMTLNIKKTPAMQMLLTSKQVAESLQVSPRKLWSLTASGKIPSIKIGRSVRYAVDDLRAAIERMRKGGEQ